MCCMDHQGSWVWSLLGAWRGRGSLAMTCRVLALGRRTETKRKLHLVMCWIFMVQFWLQMLRVLKLEWKVKQCMELRVLYKEISTRLFVNAIRRSSKLQVGTKRAPYCIPYWMRLYDQLLSDSIDEYQRWIKFVTFRAQKTIKNNSKLMLHR